MKALVLPNDTQRSICVGRTGSGKTQAGVWQLSLRSYTTMPWLIVDFKNDALIAEIPYAEVIDFNSPLDKPGIYIIRPHPDAIEELDALFLRVWEQEHVGVFVDEGYMIGGGKGNSYGFRTLLTQGRSKHIPMIICSQRPSRMTLFAFTEADFFQVFHLTYEQDRKRIAEYIPGFDTERRLGEYYSTWYNVPKDQLLTLQPVPDTGTILATFERRLGEVSAEMPGKPRKIAI